MTELSSEQAEERTQDLLKSVFESALRQENLQELASLPSEEELSKELTFTPEFEARMGKLRRRARRNTLARKLPVWSRRAAVILLSVFTVSGLALLTAPEVRAGVASIFMSWFDDHAEFRFAQEDFVEGVRWVADYVPEGFTKVSEPEAEDSVFVNDDYENSEGKRLMIQYMPAKGSGMMMDNEHSKHSVIQVCGVEGHLFEGIPDYPTMLVWTKEGIVFTIIYDLNDTEEVLKIAENITAVPK